MYGGGFTLARDRARRVEQLLRRMKRCCFLPPSAPTAEQLAASADAQLFKAIILNPYHVLNSRLPEKRSTNYRLRPRAHQFHLPQKDDKTFLPRLLFKQLLVGLVVIQTKLGNDAVFTAFIICHFVIQLRLCQLESFLIKRILYCIVYYMWWLIGRVDAFRPEGRGFESRSTRHVGTLGRGVHPL